MDNDSISYEERAWLAENEVERLREQIAKMEMTIIALMPCEMFSEYLNIMNGLDK